MNQQNQTSKRPLILAAVMLAMFMGAVEATIISTAMPSIVGDLGGFQYYSWVFSAYLLMNTVTILIYGKLSDLYGRKPIFTIGVVLFLLGSIGCGFSTSMPMLIAFRFLQGIGAGAVLPIATTIVGDLYSPEERAKIQGYLSSVWGISAVSGPAIGGIIVQSIGWPFVFFINIPIGIVSLVIVLVFLKETNKKESIHLDKLGAVLLTLSLGLFMYVIVDGGLRWGWSSGVTWMLLIISFVILLVFLLHERNAKDPMMPVELWKNRSIFIANQVSFFSGLLLIGLSTFLPTYVQGVMGQSPTVAGFTLTAISIGWPIAATIAGRLLLSIGYFATSMIGGGALVIGTLLFFFMEPSYGPLYAGFSSFFIGVGMGFTSTAFIVTIQNSVGWEKRGVATATNLFMRNLGNTIGAALFGGIVNIQLLRYLQDAGITDFEGVNVLFGEGASGFSTIELSAIGEGLEIALGTVFQILFLFALASMIFIYFLPRRKKEREEG